MSNIYSSAAAAIGNTPLVALDRLTKDLDGRILLKLDYLNPGFSKKDRPARQIIEDAERQGELLPGQPVVELTSGNMGTGLAIVCIAKAYPFIAVMSRGNSMERARMMQALGAEVVLIDQLPESKPGEVSGADLELVEEATQKICKERGAFRADQFKREGSVKAHYIGTAQEIWADTDGEIDAFCDFAGSGGTYAGCATFFAEQDRDVRCYLVEPEGAAVVAGKVSGDGAHPIQGGGYSMPELDSLKKGAPIDGFLQVTGDDARFYARKLAKEEGIFAGYSTGANIAAAVQLLKGAERGKTVVALACDSGLKYLSTDLWPEFEA